MYYEIVDVTSEAAQLTRLPGQVVLQGRCDGQPLYGASFCVREADGRYVLVSDSDRVGAYGRKKRYKAEIEIVVRLWRIGRTWPRNIRRNRFSKGSVGER